MPFATAPARRRPTLKRRAELPKPAEAGSSFLLYAVRWARGYAALGLLLGLAACQAVTPTPAVPVVRVAATDLTAPLLTEAIAAYAATAPDVRFETSLGAPARMAEQARASQVDVALLAVYPADLFATPVGVITFTLIVHPDNALTALTLLQTQAAFSGAVTDWAQLGRSDGGAIQIVSAADDADAGQAFAEVALNGLRPTRAALLAPTWAAMRQWVSEDINALGYLPVSELEASVKPLATDADLRVPVVAASAVEPSGAARAFVAWMQIP